MRSLSRIIKGSALRLTDPKVVKSSGTSHFEDPVEETREDDNNQLKELQRESQQILQETEAMIVDLLEKARDEAHSLIETARDEAELIQMKASEEAKKMKEKAREDGYKKGIERARKEMAATVAATEKEKKAVLEAARATKLQMLSDCEADILHLSRAIARKVVAAELVSNPEVILNVIREAMALLNHPDNVTVHVNPQEFDRVVLEAEKGLYGNSDQRLIKVDVLSDNQIKSGGCILESEVGMIDARLKTRWDNMEKALEEVSGGD